jgi:hypothetical protein
MLPLPLQPADEAHAVKSDSPVQIWLASLQLLAKFIGIVDRSGVRDAE